MPLSRSEIRSLLKDRGWTFVDVAARWGVSVTWMSRLVNNPHDRAAMYDDAFRGLPLREAVVVVREERHKRKPPKDDKWDLQRMYPKGRIFEAIDNKTAEEGTKLICLGPRIGHDGITVSFRIHEGAAAGQVVHFTKGEADNHLADLGIDLPNVQR